MGVYLTVPAGYLRELPLLAGSLAWFALLATTMLLTRSFDWYAQEAPPRSTG